MHTRTHRGLALLAIAILVATTACARDDAGAAPSPPADAPAASAPAHDAAPADATTDTPADPVAPADNPMLGPQLQVVRLGGTMQALAEACDVDYDAAELESAKRRQRESLQAQGVAEPDFDAAFQAAYAEGKAKLAAASATERTEACAQLRQLEQMGQALQQQR